MKTIAVAGNPNSGKSSLFNNLTGAMQHVANYAGVTVDLSSGICKVENEKLTLVDLPGTYSLTAYSQEEVVARDYIIQEKPDAVLVVLDASNLERNLYFLVQILELKVPVVVALNMVDVAESKGFLIDHIRMGELLGVSVVPTVAAKGKGISELKEAMLATANSRNLPKALMYGHEMQTVFDELRLDLTNCSMLQNSAMDLDWLALKLLLDDVQIIERVNLSPDKDLITAAIQKAKNYLRLHSDEESQTAVTEARYAIAAGIVKECQRYTQAKRQNLTDKIDAVVCNRVLGPILMLGFIYLLFTFAFNLAEEIAWIPLFNGEWVTPHGIIEMFFEYLANVVETSSMGELTKSLLVNGIINGVGGVLGFTPLIFFIFMFVAILEDSGYVARIAFILDRLLRWFGLEGKSILALIVSGGFGAGCAVPGIMATRTLRDEKDRLVTILVAPMMNCGAKMPVYAMLVGAFFADGQAEMMILIWALSWTIALCSAFCLRKFVIKGASTPFIMELPIYHLPTFKGVMLHTWNRTWDYVKKAGTILLAMSIVLWALMAFPRAGGEKFEELSEENQMKYQLEQSIAGKVGSALEPISKYAGFDWRDNIALVGGFAAKEVVVQTLGTAYSMGEVDSDEPGGLKEKLKYEWSKTNSGRRKALAFIVFVMIYAPCVATLAVILKETKSWKWTIFASVYTTSLAFILATIIYQVGGLIMN